MGYGEASEHDVVIRAMMIRWFWRGGLALLLLCCGCLYGCPVYSVWQQHMHGKAELSRAEYAKQVAVQDALARKNSAALLGEADTLRAHGQARANAILAHSLVGAEGQAYLRYLWIQGLGEGGRTPTVIYVPTEAGIPILEAGHGGKQ